MEKEQNELREPLGILEERLCTGTRQYASEDGTRPSFLKKTTATWVLCSVSTKKTVHPQEHKIVDLDVVECVVE